MSGYVFDHTALLALGAGNRQLSRLVDAAHQLGDRHLYAPAMCLAAAVADRPGLADHLGALPALEVVDLGYAEAVTVGACIAVGVDWRAAQAIGTGRPTADWPTGRPVVTAVPESYAGWGVEVVPVG
ncbi:MAG TPA: hypothetical protein VLJ59_15070 [Mycobacteriales bacterium]|nr:hypothetical protein [Mycobacteriales bacterium]